MQIAIIACGMNIMSWDNGEAKIKTKWLTLGKLSKLSFPAKFPALSIRSAMKK